MPAKKAIGENWAHVKRTPFGTFIYEATGCIGKFRLHVYIFLPMDEVLKKHSTSLLVVITDTAPIFCAKNKCQK